MKKIFLLASMALAFSGFAQKVNNKLSFQKGQKLEMLTKVSTTVSQAMGDANVDASFTQIFDVNDVANGNASIEHKIKHINFNIESAMGQQSFDSDKEADMKSGPGKNLEKTLKSKYTVTLDQTGKVVSVKKDDDNPGSTDANQGDMMTGMMSQFSGAFIAPKAGDRSEFMVLPGREISKGESWTDSTDGGMANYTISDINDNEIIIDYKVNGTNTRKQEAMGMEINITTTDKTTGRITLDRKTGLLKEKLSVTDSEGNMEAMGQSMPLTSKTTKTVTVKAG
jgi:hypothetical protein